MPMKVAALPSTYVLEEVHPNNISNLTFYIMLNALRIVYKGHIVNSV
jgi:hypothetical protein